MSGFALPVTTAAMEAKLVDALPDGPGWRFEPKWDGFRCLVYRDGESVALMSKSGKPLDRYFPEVVARVAAMRATRFVVDGELVIEHGATLSFDALQARLHPAASRIARLSTDTPARLILFDALADATGDLSGEPLPVRRAALEAIVAPESDLLLSPFTTDAAIARNWLDAPSAAIDGVVAKPEAEPYRPGKRTMLKVKRRHTADCVVGGFRVASGNGGGVGSLLLGLYDDAGLLDHVGFVAALPPAVRDGLRARLDALVAPPGFTGKAPGGPSRWATDRSADWHPLRPELVVEVAYDQVTADRLRHAAAFVRWRPDKDPRQCRMEQLARPANRATLAAVLDLATHGKG